MERIDLPAGTVHYRSSGPADGRPVVVRARLPRGHQPVVGRAQRLAEAGYRTYAPTWPLGAHTTAMKPGADLSPRGVAKVVIIVPRGPRPHRRGARRQRHRRSGQPARAGRGPRDGSAALALTNCDAFDTFPPFPFDRALQAWHGTERPARAAAPADALGVPAQQQARVRLAGHAVTSTAEESRPWVTPYLSDAGVRRDVTDVRPRLDRRDELDGPAPWLARFDRPVLLCWAPKDPFFKLSLAHAAGRDVPGRDAGRVPRSPHVRVPRPARAAGRGDPRLAEGHRRLGSRIGSPPCRSTP